MIHGLRQDAIDDLGLLLAQRGPVFDAGLSAEERAAI
jgi:hypothetical protein